MLDPVDISSLRPFKQICLDMFEYKKIHYLSIIDRMSGFLFIEEMGRHTTSKDMVNKIKKLTYLFGNPRVLKYDDGLVFRSKFTQFIEDIGAKGEMSSGYFSQSNGVAECGVRCGKHLIKKCKREGSCWQQALAYLRVTPREDGYSPSELFLSGRPWTMLPELDQPKLDMTEIMQKRTEKDKKNKASTHSCINIVI